MFNLKSYLHMMIQVGKVFAWQLIRPELKIGKRAVLGTGSYFGKGRKIIIGDNFFCGRHCHLSCPAQIGDDVMLASGVALVGGDHNIDFISTTINRSGRDVMKTVTIEDNVWVGHGAILMHGVTLKTGAVVAAGSVVTRDVESNAIVGGNPARLIRFRKFKGIK